MKQTAVEWLVERIKLDSKSKENSNGGISFTIGLSKIDKIFEQAKEMEKEQMIDAFVECWKENMPEGYECKQSAEQYYNETFKL